ncbi:unnamed protein product [Microthlaspi erraticum]|uniref:MATH domain-containing protein n=1 Tax=Microthlaspi erraticum TaxID=1685480 RepID=A0A6D2JPL4_9BRAS|nr:unnamed protein product [Microthlaspi erraticum]
METESKKALSWQIDNFSERTDGIYSDPFSSGGCEWNLRVYPKGNLVDDHLSLFLFVANPESLLPGWSRRASYRFVLLDQSGKVLFRTSEASTLFSAETPNWGYHRMLPHTKLLEEGFLENNKLIVEVYINVVEVIHEGKSTANEIVTVHGFQVLNSQANSVSRIFAEHQDVAVGIRSDIAEVKTAYMNILLGLIETLGKPPQSLSETELSNAESELSELTEAGFKLDWLKSKLEEVTLNRKKALSDLKVELENEKIKSDVDAAAAPRTAWYVTVYPKGNGIGTHMSMYLEVADPLSLPRGWSRDAIFRFLVVNQSSVLCSKSLKTKHHFNEKKTNRGFKKALRLTKLHNRGYLVDDKLIIEVHVLCYDAICFHPTKPLLNEKKKTVSLLKPNLDVVSVEKKKDIDDVNSFQSQVLAEHPDIAVGFKPKNQVVKTAYMTVLFDLIEKVNKPPHCHSETELSNIYIELSDLTEVGFKLDWLKSKLDEVSLERKKSNADSFRAQQLEERVKNLELMFADLKAEVKQGEGQIYN